MASQKKVIVRNLDGILTWGYLPATEILKDNNVQLLDTAGRVQPLPLSQIKSIAYVKDFNLRDTEEPERLGRRTFAGRPRAEGLWLKLEFTDGDVLEGLAHFDLGFVQHLTEDRCIGLAPPDPKSNTQKLLVPRTALANVEILGWINPPARRKLVRPSSGMQADLFKEP